MNDLERRVARLEEALVQAHGPKRLPMFGPLRGVYQIVRRREIETAKGKE